MTAKFDVSTLNWIKGEIDASLDQARLALEAFAEAPDNETQMGFCIMHLHQVHGTLQMVELYGAALVASTMEQLAIALQEKRVKDESRASEALMRAILQLPDYLEGLQAGQADNALVMLPLINELRQFHGESELPVSDFFQPDLTVMPPAGTGASHELSILAQKVRPYYQSALLRLLRDEDAAQGLKILLALSGKMFDAAHRPEVRQWFWIFSGFLAALEADRRQLRTVDKRLLGVGEQVIREISEQGEGAFQSGDHANQLATLLFRIAQSDGESERLADLRTAFFLDRLLADIAVQGPGGFNAELKKTLAHSILEELSLVQDALDLFMRGDDRTAVSLLPIIEPLARMSSTLSMMEQPLLQQALEQQSDVIQSLQGSQDAVGDDVLMDIASAVVSVETALRDWGTLRPLEQADDLAGQLAEGEISQEAEAEYQRVIRQVMKEARKNLLQVKDAVDLFIAAPADTAPLEPLPGILHETVGGLNLLSYTRAAQVLRACSLFIQNDLEKEENYSSPAQLDALADALTSIEYYMDAFVESRVHPAVVLEVAERACAQLGYPVGTLDGSPEEAVESEAAESSEAEGRIDEGVPDDDPEYSSELLADGLSGLDFSSELLPDLDFTDGMPADVTTDTAPGLVEGVSGYLDQVTVADGDSETEVQAGKEFPESTDSQDTPASVIAGLPDEQKAEDGQEEETITPGPAVVSPAISAGLDPEIVEIFIEEAGEVIEQITECLPRWQANMADDEVLQDLRRAFHTLKGSGRLVGAQRIGEFGWAFENMLNRVIDKTVKADNAMFDLLDQAIEVLPELVSEFSEGTAVLADVDWLQDAANAMSEPGGLERLLQDTVLATDVVVDATEDAVCITDEDVEEVSMDPVLLEIYANETDEHLAAIRKFVEASREIPENQISEALIRALHTLQGSSRMAGVSVVADVAKPLERFSKDMLTARAPVQPSHVDALEQCTQYTADILQLLQDGSSRLPKNPFLVDVALEMQDHAKHLVEGLEAVPEEGLVQHTDEPAAVEAMDELLADEAVDELTADEVVDELTADEAVDELPANEVVDAPPALDAILSAIDISSQGELHGSQAGTDDVLQEQLPEAPVDISPDEADFDLLSLFLEEAMEISDTSEELLQAWRNEPDNRSLVTGLQRQLHTLKGSAFMAGVQPIGNLSHTLESIFEDVAEGRLERTDPMFDLLQLAQDRLASMIEQVRNSQPVHSADDLIGRIRQLAAGERDDSGQVADGLLVERAGPEDTTVQDAGVDIGPADEGVTEGTLPDEIPYVPALRPRAVPEEPVPTRRYTASPGTVEDRLADGLPIQPIAQQQEMVRVPADLLDTLVNQAGEVSIYRSRVEQQIGRANYNLRDLSDILKRMHEQLRQFSIEAEAQMQSRYEDLDSARHEDFDPLEFDRFTNMQQISRSAMESLSDIAEVQQQMHNLMRETETLLLQQSRVSTELQEGLMHTRMVPLTSYASRLRRIVRQVSAELGKEVELKLSGADVEMDRHVIERMLAPIEHLLRNAIAHGIESPAQRDLAGKPRRGRITLALVREGPDVVIRVMDDGAGINLENVRSKAIERGMIKPDADLSDREVVHFIMDSGFTTAENLTKVSGRGVGMDVVNNEIKQLSGILQIDTRQGEGTTFTIRLPVTLSITRALLVRLADQIYAVPITSVQGVVRVEKDKLAALFAEEQPRYAWLGHEHELFRLADTLGIVSVTAGTESQEKYPLLFIHSGDHYVAWAVDELLGGREIVVKSLGPQLSSLRGLAGATILGDGNVALILDLPLLARLGLAQRSVMPEAGAAEQEEEQPLVMVVDDSITVRKVTSRLLERNEMRVVTAKDGVDAIARLEEHMPDVMLLDIEMPRMDGYELATHIRRTERLSHIPIIMITSRSGDKHRQRAMDIGVNAYLTKPYQEAGLMENIQQMLALKTRRETPGNA